MSAFAPPRRGFLLYGEENPCRPDSDRYPRWKLAVQCSGRPDGILMLDAALVAHSLQCGTKRIHVRGMMSWLLADGLATVDPALGFRPKYGAAKPPRCAVYLPPWAGQTVPGQKPSGAAPAPPVAAPSAVALSTPAVATHHRKLPAPFRPALQYSIRNGALADLQWLDEDLRRSISVVYARTYGDDVVYVGKTQKTLEARMREHLRYVATDAFRRTRPYREWAEGKTIVTFALAPGYNDWHGMQVALADGLEIHLITALRPRFNLRLG